MSEVYRIALTDTFIKDVEHQAIIISNFSTSPTSAPVFRNIVKGDIILATMGMKDIKAVFQAIAAPYVTSVDYCASEVNVVYNGFLELPFRILRIFKNTIDGEEFFRNARLVNKAGRRSRFFNSRGHIIQLHSRNQTLFFNTINELLKQRG
jgi:hypothetical protein